MKSKVRLRTVHRKQRGGSSNLRGVSPPVFAFVLLAAPWVLLLLLLFSKSSCQNKVVQNPVSNSTELHPLSRYTQIGDETGITGPNLGPKTQGQKMTKNHLVESGHSRMSNK
jgi:hypothetical protein